jgi:hypothetical protein
MKKKNQKNNGISVLATDFRQVDININDWTKKREKKSNIYHAYSEYIECLKNSLEHVESYAEKIEIEKEIQKLTEEQKQFYVPTILERARLDLFREQVENKHALEGSNYELVKKIENYFKN